MWVWLFMLLGIIGIRCLIPDALGEKKKNLIFLSLSFAIIVFVVGSRSAHLTISSDLHNYYNWYSRSINLPLGELLERSPFEDGYMVLNKVLAIIMPWKYFIIYFEAAFTTGVFLWYIYRNCDSVFLGVVIYICIGPWQFFLTGFRQSFAMCICLFALELMKNNKQMTDLGALALIALAATMHETAWVFLALFIVRRVNLTKKVAVYAAVMTLFMLVFLDDIVALGNNFFDKEYDLSYSGNALGGLVPILIYAGTFVLWYLIWSWNNDFIKEHEFELKILILGLCIYTLRYNSLVMERVSFYYTQVAVILLANGITRQKTKIVRNISMAICVAACGGLFLHRVLSQLGEYHFYWEYLEGLVYL